MSPGVPASDAASIAPLVLNLQDDNPRTRQNAAQEIFRRGRQLAELAIASWLQDVDLRQSLRMGDEGFPEMVVGVAVGASAFERIRATAGMPHLADVPPDQDAREFEISFPQDVRLDILTSREPDGTGAIARYLRKFGAGIQQIEILSRDVEQTTKILRTRFSLNPIYPAVQAGAGGTRINFFLVPGARGGKVLIEIVQEP